MEFDSQIVGSINFNYVNNANVKIIQSFLRGRSSLDQHLTEVVGHKATFSLPYAEVTNISIVFKDDWGEYLNVTESLKTVTSFLRSIETTGITIDVIHNGYDYDDIVHYTYDDNTVKNSKATIEFNNYQAD